MHFSLESSWSELRIAGNLALKGGVERPNCSQMSVTPSELYLNGLVSRSACGPSSDICALCGSAVVKIDTVMPRVWSCCPSVIQEREEYYCSKVQE